MPARARRPRGAVLRPIGVLRSPIRRREEAPKFYTEGAPDATLEVFPRFWPALRGVRPGDELIVLTWLHRAHRHALRVHPRGDPTRPLTGVFLTRSPDRPNPIGLHRVRVRSVRKGRILLGPIEAIDGTPVVDVKPVVSVANDS